MKLRSATEVMEEILSEDPLREYFTWWDKVNESDLKALEIAINSATREEDIQQFLQKNPSLLIQHLGGGHGRWVIPKQRLGVEHVTDFMIGQRSSIGFEWQAVELESPKTPLFNKNGDPSQYLNHAVRQIQDWRSWLMVNQNYAARPKSNSGLGLTDIPSNIPGLILIGRRSPDLEKNNERRRQMSRDLNIQIHTYDFLIESLKGRVESISRRRQQNVT
jgi:hypothetical protein